MLKISMLGAHIVISSVRARPMQQALNQMGNSNMQFMQMQMPGPTLRVGEQGTSRLALKAARVKGPRVLEKKNWWPFPLCWVNSFSSSCFLCSHFDPWSRIQDAVFNVFRVRWVLDSKVPDLQVAFVVELSDDLNRCVHLLSGCSWSEF